MFPQGAESRARRVEQHVVEPAGAQRRRGRCQVCADELDIAMAQASRERASIAQTGEIDVERDYAPRVSDHLRQVRRLAAGRSGAIDHACAGARREQSRHELRCLRLRMKNAHAI